MRRRGERSVEVHVGIAPIPRRKETRLDARHALRMRVAGEPGAVSSGIGKEEAAVHGDGRRVTVHGFYWAGEARRLEPRAPPSHMTEQSRRPREKGPKKKTRTSREGLLHRWRTKP